MLLTKEINQHIIEIYQQESEVRSQTLANIEKERIKRKITQGQLAMKIGVSHKTYYNWINEKKDIPSQKLKKMSRMFKTNMEYLLGEEQKRVLYLCDGNVPTCKKNTCYKNPKRKGDCPPCTYTKDVAYALNFHKTSEHVHAAYYENGQPE